MKKKYIFILLVLLLTALCFVPVSQQKSFLIKSPFLNVYVQLQSPENWKRWRSDLRNATITDSDKIATKTFPNAFIINYKDLALDVKLLEGSFKVSEQNTKESIDYYFTVLPGKTLTNSLLVVRYRLPLIKYLAGSLKDGEFKNTHATDLKDFIETDSLFYGYNIFKTRVPYDNLIVQRKAVVKTDKFTEAVKMLSDLKEYIKINNIKQMAPVIAQFLPKGKDSAQVNIGLFIDKEIKSDKTVQFVRMPKGGTLYSVKFIGKFSKRQNAYNGLKQYCKDHGHQSVILPFETYFDDKLPTTDTDKINIQINFTAYF